ncbi:hypothetical protein FWU19_10235 [Bordetella pertussis]|nr:hypothetical protein [Bordetella pertussis]URM46501.1 hypothetical protein LMF30_10930 [Bordetella pertussis CS]WAZ41688.1 hypothetical protein FT144_08580 [Bordetella pertussis]WAZ45621.1 hypothetical protein FC431_10310 [Bordetella pertussis]WIO78991.1 hypothetical protein J9G29_08980 [Bordetella pertussis]WIO79339.1 hypothetical protein J9G33_10130 [Bordetella pertussis]
MSKVAHHHAQQERHQRRHQCDGRDIRQARGAQEQQAEERAVVDRAGDVGAAIAAVAVLPGVGEPQAAVAVVEGGQHGQDGNAQHAVQADEMAQQDDQRGRHQRLHQQDGAGRGQDRTAGAHVDLRAGGEDQQRDQRQRAVLEQCGGKAADGQRVRRERTQQRSEDQRQQHEAARHFHHGCVERYAGNFGSHDRLSP